MSGCVCSATGMCLFHERELERASEKLRRRPNPEPDWRALAARLAEALRAAAPVVLGVSVTQGWPQAVAARPLVDGALSAYDAATKGDGT